MNSPLALIALGTIYLFHYTLTGQSAENLKFSTKTRSVQVILIINLLICLLFHNTSFSFLITTVYTSACLHLFTLFTLVYTCLHNKHKSDFTDNEFGQFLAGLIEGDG